MGKSLEGKVAIVTGSGQGIGRGIAIGLAREGAKIITNNRKKGSGSLTRYNREDMPEEDWKQMLSLAGDAESTAELIKSEGGEAIPFFGDVSKPEVAEKLVKLAMDTWGRIDIIVNNAAGLGTGSILSLTEKDWDYLTVSRAKAAFNMMHYAVPVMMEALKQSLNSSRCISADIMQKISPRQKIVHLTLSASVKNSIDGSVKIRSKDFKVSDYSHKVFEMFNGEETRVKLQCKNELMKYVIDRFGEKVETEPTHEDRFICYVNVRLSPTFYGWVFGFGGDIRILAPSEAVEEIIDMSKRMITAESM